MNLTLVGVRLRAIKHDLSSNFAQTSRLTINAGLLGIAFACVSLSSAFANPSHVTTSATQANPEAWDKLADTVFRHLSMQQGLPQYSATSLAQDSDGFIWVGTQGGLARWDGYRFRNYLPQANDPHSLPDNYVMSLHQDSKGRLWVGTNGGGLAMYDKSLDRFVRVPTGPGGISHVTVSSITSDEKGNLWLATRAGLNFYDPQTGKVRQFHVSDDGLPSDLVRTVARDGQGNIWVGTSEGLAKFDARTEQLKRVPLPIAAGKAQRVVAVCASSDGKVWIGTFDSGAFYITPDDPEPKRLLVQKPNSKVAETINENVYFIQKTADDEVWLGTYGRGILVVNTKTLETKRLVHETNRPSSLADNSVWSIIRDRSGLIWVGSQRGISIHDPSSKAILSLFGGDNRANGLQGIDFFAAHGFDDGSVWVGSQHQGISILDPNSQTFRALKGDDANPQSALPQSAVFTIYPVGANDVYVGTDKGLYLTDRRGNSVRRLNLTPRNPVLRVAALLHVEQRLYIGGPEGLWEKDLSKPNQDTVMQTDWAKSLGTKFITELKRAPDGAIWVATLQDGLYRYDPISQQLSNIKPDPKSKSSLTHRNVSSMLFDSRGWLWVGMQGGGLDILRPGKQAGQFDFQHIGKAEKLPNDLVNKVLEDHTGQIWVSTDEGLAKIDPKTLEVQPLAEPDGVAIMGYWSTSGAKTRDGNLIFGGVGGMTVVRPSLLKPYEYRPPLVVTSIQLGGKTLAVNHARFVGDNAEKLVIQADANSMVVEFAALDYSAAEHNRYAYRLEGYDKNWIETDYTRRLAAYTNLPPGDYRLHLRGTNRNGVWSEPDLMLNVRVMPAWFQTWWAYLLYLALFSALVYSLLRWRLWALRNKNRNLELLIQERTRELEVSRRALEQQSLTDPLTGLRNRRYLNLCIADDIAEVQRSYSLQAENKGEANRNLIFMMVDIDHFKSVNDQYGHAAGDQVLNQTTSILRESVRDSDTIIRWGGEEFLIVVRHTHFAEAELLAERIRSRIAEHHFRLSDGKTLQRSCSIGLATYPFMPKAIEAYSWEQVVGIADKCLYAAKRAGRNAWVGLYLLDNAVVQAPSGDLALEIEQLIEHGAVKVRSSLADTSELSWIQGWEK
ncbi:diguanylate cyclase [Undibacterium sp. LX40W]|uniref:diguanylate cyclase n=1 Tax=Undibacterium nitidum TaxID=2762298 RepID=A0A923HTL9_9BURK|nr:MULTISPECIES: ligand-binding sensor domain-containing diguanylate cyclase [Undibacterium]MBC3883130.1 diguanylate cyclase [Undibacterium nitidum]MBC3893412.1 diguanylate cyclase [Undibacterium sp. LX40W]